MMSDISRVQGPHLPITGICRVRIRTVATRYPGPRYHRNKAFTRKTFGSGDVVADCRKVVTGTPSNDTVLWGLNINGGLSDQLSS